MHDTREKEDHTWRKMQGLGRNPSGEDEEFKWEVFGREKRDFLSREIREKWEKIMLRLYIKIRSSIDRELLSTNSRHIYLSRCYWELSIAKRLRWIEQLLSIYRADRKFLDGSWICWEAIDTNSQKLRWIKIALTSVEKGR